MRYRHWMLVSALVAALLGGCGGSDDSPEPGDTDSESSALNESSTPDKVVTLFLEAFCRGDDATTATMLTEAARQEAAKHNFEVAPPGSDTATFKVGKTEYIHETLAQVPAIWSDIGPDGQKEEDETIWRLRRRPEGWRIAGMAATVFPGEPPVLLDFENIAEMQQKRAMVNEEIRRRANNALNTGGPTNEPLPEEVRRQQAAAPINPENSVREASRSAEHSDPFLQR